MTKKLILDTSALIAGGGKILTKLKKVDIIIPIAVLEDIHQQLKNPTLAAAAVSVFNIIESLMDVNSVEYGLTQKNKTKITIEANHLSPRDREASTKTKHLSLHHQRLVNIALNFKAENNTEVELITQDPLLRSIAAGVFKITVKYVDNYINHSDIVYQPDAHIDLDNKSELLDALYHKDDSDSEEDHNYKLDELKKIMEAKLITEPDQVTPANTVFTVKNFVKNKGTHTLSLVHYNHANKEIKPVSKAEKAFDVTGKSLEQQIALHYLLDVSVPVVSLSGTAGTGKTFLAIAAALEQVMGRGKNEYKKIIVFRPLYAVGGQELGYLPGSEKEKMDPWAAAVYDAMDAITPEAKGYAKDKIEVIPVTHIRGRTFNDAFIIVDEAQNLEYTTLLAILSRMGADTKTVLLWDTAQRDNMKIDRQGGIQALYQKLVGNPMFAHKTLVKNERSPMAQLAGNLLEEIM